MRLDKLLAHCGFGTRKEVKQLIKNGYVKVNGEVIKKDKHHEAEDCGHIAEPAHNERLTDSTQNRINRQQRQNGDRDQNTLAYAGNSAFSDDINKTKNDAEKIPCKNAVIRNPVRIASITPLGGIQREGEHKLMHIVRQHQKK